MTKAFRAAFQRLDHRWRPAKRPARRPRTGPCKRLEILRDFRPVVLGGGLEGIPQEMDVKPIFGTEDAQGADLRVPEPTEHLRLAPVDDG